MERSNCEVCTVMPFMKKKYCSLSKALKMLFMGIQVGILEKETLHGNIFTMFQFCTCISFFTFVV